MTVTSAGPGGSRDELVLEHLVKVRWLARSLARRLWRSDPDDLYQAGAVALVERAAAYDPTRGAKFWTYASQRVEGAMIDFWRATHREMGRGGQRIAHLQQLDTELEELEQIQTPEPDPREELLTREVKRAIGREVMALKGATRVAAVLYFWRGKNCREIGEALGISETGGWKLVEGAKRRLRRRLRELK